MGRGGGFRQRGGKQRHQHQRNQARQNQRQFHNQKHKNQPKNPKHQPVAAGGGQNWGKVGRKLKLKSSSQLDGGWRIQGRFQGLDITLKGRPHSPALMRWELQIAIAHLPSSFRLQPRSSSFWARSYRPFTGDPGFDKQVDVSGPAALGQALLDEDTRRKILPWIQRGVEIAHSTLTWESHQSSSSTYNQLLKELCGFLLGLKIEWGAIPEKLLEQLQTESVEGARVQKLVALFLEYPNFYERHLAEIPEQLFWPLLHHEARDIRYGAIRALGEHGSKEAFEPLRQLLGSNWGKLFEKRAARQALEQLARRFSLPTGGELSLLPPQGGELSSVEVGEGALSGL